MPSTDTETDILARRRALIDLVAETRSRSVRVALFGALVHRPDPDAVETDEERAAHLAVLLDTCRWIARVESIVRTGRDPWDEYTPDLCQWVSEHAAQSPDILESLNGIARLSGDVGASAKSGGPDLGEALRAHYAFRRAGFMEAVTAFCDGMWATIDAERSDAVAQANEAGEAIRATLVRLESIGKHVRLVSINASVEAARMGGTGRGVGVIAQEFKSLSEEIQSLSLTAAEKIARLTSRDIR